MSFASQINGTSVEGARHSDAVRLLTGPEREVVVEVEREFALPVKRITNGTSTLPLNRNSYFVEPSSKLPILFCLIGTD